jgi:hypothetical protein
MLEGILISAGPLVLKEVYNKILPETNIYYKLGILIVSIYLYTLAVLTYRCKYKTESKPKIDFIKAFYVILVFIIYYAIIIALSYATTPITSIIKNLLSKSIVFFLISYLVYYNSLQASHPDCFEESLLSKIFGFIGSIFGFIGDILGKIF